MMEGRALSRDILTETVLIMLRKMLIGFPKV
jgi:hypothetical protein